MNSYKEKMNKATIGSDTLEIMGIIGSLHDLIEQYRAWYERTYKAICKNDGIPDFEYEKVCEAFRPAQEFMEDIVHERLTDFLTSLNDDQI